MDNAPAIPQSDLSGAQKGSTGRPISLLSEFLIQRATR